MAQSLQLAEERKTLNQFPHIALPSQLSWEGNSENWMFFKQKFEIYLLASGNSVASFATKCYVAVKDRLLRTKELTLARALEICCTSQRTKQQVEAISSPSACYSGLHNFLSQIDISDQKSLNMVRNNTKENIYPSTSAVNTHVDIKRHSTSQQQKKRNGFICKNCGYSHDRYKCPAFGKNCLKCGKRNHFSTKCRSISEIKENDDECNEIDMLFLG
ncbi:hypothetical protein evm_002215 [Chilo suppressalis]|nr:hypothetical protein evm_002215 [Chilo suppressalis]